jgi:hypothetical protein
VRRGFGLDESFQQITHKSPVQSKE